MPNRLSHEEFVAAAFLSPSIKKIIGTYNGQHKGANKLIVVCPKGHVSKPMGPMFILRRMGCIDCYRPKKTTETFAKELKRLKKPFKLIGEYVGDGEYVKVECLTCGHKWEQTPNVLRYQKTCWPCAVIERKRKQHRIPFAERLKQIASMNPHVQIIGDYIDPGLNTRLNYSCKFCGKTFTRSMENLVRKSTRCICKMGVNSGLSYSNIALDWLEEMSKKNRIVIEHAKNKGEFRIPGTRMRVDGFNRRTNTVFEFLGDYWHKERQSYQKAIGRLKRIRALGYNVIYIWQSEFQKGLPAKEL